MKILKNQKGFGLVEGLLIIIAITLVAFVGFYVYNANKEEPDASDSSISQAQKDNETEETQADANEGYLVVEDWGIKFKIPDNLTDVRYKISGDDLGIFAKPIQDEDGKPFDVEYPSDYDKVDEEYGLFSYSQGNLTRSKDSSKDYFGEARKGKKLGDYYYYTSHSFSSLASGAGPNGIFLDEDCLEDFQLKKCDRYYLAESVVFAIVNGSLHPETGSEVKDALLPSIELL